MPQTLTMPSPTGPALRLRLLELYLSTGGAPETALTQAQAAERWVAGDGPQAARSVVPGQAWTFSHRSLADVSETDDGATSVDDLIGPRRQELLQMWQSGCSIVPDMTRHFQASRATLNRALQVTGIATDYPRAPQGHPRPQLSPPVAEVAQPAQSLTPAPDVIIRRRSAPKATVNDPAAPADMETVVSWLRSNRCTVTMEAEGLYCCDGAVMTSPELLRRANKARKALQLPPFTVRKI